MKRFTNILLTLGLILPMLILSTGIKAQTQVETLKKDQDTLKENVSTLRDKISGVEERIATAEGDLAKLTKIKVSGYLQAQWQNFEASNVYPNNLFSVRRARIKFTYEPLEGVAFVLQPDFAPGNITLKDAYVQLNDKWLKTFSLFAGKFNRPDYEVEYSSSSREVPERSRVIKAIYPDERAIGVKLEIAPPKVPIKVQLAVFNGNDGISINNPVYNYGTGKWDKSAAVIQNTDFDNYKDFMGRITYAFKLEQWGGLTIGAHGYYGQIKANSTDLLKSDYAYDTKLTSVGKGVKKNWVGFETQFYLDVLGGLTLKGEYIFGVNSTPGYNGSASFTTNSSSMKKGAAMDTLVLTTITNTTVNKAPAISRNFFGYYVYLIKNIGKRNQVAVRYDYYNPNTKLKADSIGGVTARYEPKVADAYGVAKASTMSVGNSLVTENQYLTKTTTVNKLVSGVDDIPYGTWTFSYSYFFTDNIKIMLAYEIPMNKKVGLVDAKGKGPVYTDYTVNNVKGTYDYSNVIKQNVLTLRLQAKF
ncbi:MAG: hypothetical protein NT040_06910 [Bacteroidetes bacterium]|nr:hypothetical protein [Bacteroidota bacterium]